MDTLQTTGEVNLKSLSTEELEALKKQKQKELESFLSNCRTVDPEDLLESGPRMSGLVVNRQGCYFILFFESGQTLAVTWYDYSELEKSLYFLADYNLDQDYVQSWGEVPYQPIVDELSKIGDHLEARRRDKVTQEKVQRDYEQYLRLKAVFEPNETPDL